MKSRFALSFGISLIVVGVLNLFLKTSNIILFALSLSAFIFSVINILFATKIHGEKYEMIYIFPIVILLIFFCYGNELMEINMVKFIVNSKLTSALTFVSFGLIFVSEYIIEGNFKLLEKVRHLTLACEMMNYTMLLQDAVIKYRKEVVDKKIIVDKSSKKFVDEIEALFKEKTKKAKIEGILLKQNLDKYTIDDFDKAYTQANEILQSKQITNKIYKETNENN